jgi:hypothetical protein
VTTLPAFRRNLRWNPAPELRGWRVTERLRPLKARHQSARTPAESCADRARGWRVTAPKLDPQTASLPCLITGSCDSRVARDIPSRLAPFGSSAAALARRLARRRDRGGAGPARVSGHVLFGRPPRKHAAWHGRTAPPQRSCGTRCIGGWRPCTSVASAWNRAAFSAARWITIRPPASGRLRRHVDHYPAAKWIRGTRPLKL